MKQSSSPPVMEPTSGNSRTTATPSAPRSRPDEEGSGAHAPVRVMLVDDSLVIRSVLEHMIERSPDFQIVASVANAQEALDFLARDRVDVVVLDIEMPIMNGLDALPDILERGKDARVLILSSNAEEGGPAAVEALALGASDTLAKPGRTRFGGTFSEIFHDRLRRLGHSKRATRKASEYVRVAEKRHRVEPAPPASSTLQCIAVGASTGGIPSMQAFLAGLAKEVSAPILLTQHLPDAFIPFFARQLGDMTTRKVRVAEDDMRIEANHIYLAPGQGHLSLYRDERNDVRVRITHGPVDSGCEPSVDPMFSAVAKVYGERACAILLSGMGRDGLHGARDLHGVGVPILAQNPETCVVWGMPGAVVRDGIASAVLAPDAIASYLNRWGSK